MFIVINCLGMPFNGNTINERSLGGSETAAYYMAKELAAKGHRVSIYTNMENPENDEGEFDGVRYLWSGEQTNESPMGERFHFFAQSTPHDVLIIQRSPYAFRFRYASKVNLWWVHDLPTVRQRDEISSQVWNLDGILTVSEFHKEQYARVYGINPDVIFPIQNGVDLELFEDNGAMSHNVLSNGEHINKIKLLYSSRPERGLEHLVAPGGLMERLGAVDKNVHLYVCAYDNTVGQMADYYQYLSSRCQSLPNVTVLGSLTKQELADVMRQCDALVYPTPGPKQPNFDEVSCITAMEAMAAGLPIITSNRGALPETCKDSGTMLVEMNDKDEVDLTNFFTAVSEFIHLSKEDKQEVKKTQLEAAKRYSWDKSADMLMKHVEHCFKLNRSNNAVARHLMLMSDIYAFESYLDRDDVISDAILLSTHGELNDCYEFALDNKFYEHYGIDPRGIARAAVATLTGQGVQGGSTLTQQLVKNYFLSSERTLRRKITEMIMAVLLEMHYTKEEILEAYINEVYLGQEGDRAIHGFGLASHFFFARPVEQLELQHIATLVGMLKGPNYYEPRANPERALQRRDLVLDTMTRQEFVTQEQYVYAKDEPLGVTREPPSGTSPYPAFLELVQRQLRRDYRDEDLRSEGLRILTTLDPRAQRSAERALSTRLVQIEKRKRRIEANSLEGAVVVTSTQDGEVQALVSGRNPTFRGFNRALDAQRPIGSLIKPVVYLTALAQPQDYTLITPLDDNQLIFKQRGTKDWKPMNYDKEFHGRVPLRLALARSYNVATARLGLTLGVPEVMAAVQRLGVDRDLPGHASSLLGVNELRPIEVAQMYQTLASGGFRVPLRSIREILTADGHTLQRFPLAVEQMADPAAVYLLTRAMQGVVREGTAKGLLRYVSPDLNVAGKTGTTDELRDSWFAGFTGDRLAVVWVGRDDNTPSRLTGSSGAMTIWGTMMRELDPEPLVPPQPENIELVWIDPATGLRADEACQGALELPFISGSAPQQTAPCVQPSTDKNTTKKGWLKRMLH